MLTAIEPTDQRKANHVMWRCRCDCGNEKLVSAQHLVSGSVKSCGCAVAAQGKKKVKDLEGNRYGRLVVLDSTDLRSGNSVIWRCQCDCGNICLVSGANLRNGCTTSCGCYASDVHKKTAKTLYDSVLSKYQVDGTFVPSLRSEPSKSNTSGVVGVTWDSSVGLWRARISFQGVTYQLGARKNFDDAVALRREAESMHDDFLLWYAKKYPDAWEKIKSKFPKIVAAMEEPEKMREE